MIFVIAIGLIIGFISLASSYGITCGLVYLITLCFGWQFSWPAATGVWLCLLLLNIAFRSVIRITKED